MLIDCVKCESILEVKKISSVPKNITIKCRNCKYVNKLGMISQNSHKSKLWSHVYNFIFG